MFTFFVFSFHHFQLILLNSHFVFELFSNLIYCSIQLFSFILCILLMNNINHIPKLSCFNILTISFLIFQTETLSIEIFFHKIKTINPPPTWPFFKKVADPRIFFEKPATFLFSIENSRPKKISDFKFFNENESYFIILFFVSKFLIFN